ncbi:MAG: FAD-binding protein [Deltaproteobacteria bacterium]|nr:FAD-binding protein [Deltaproteobacteria bacterium]
MPEYEVLVVGGGVAGLRAALAAHETGVRVALLSKTHPVRSHDSASPGGFNAALSPEDSAEHHAQDSADAGAGLCEVNALKAFCEEAAQEALCLDHLGAPFNRTSEGMLALRRLNGSRAPRAVFAADFTGHVVLHTLYEQLLKAQIPTYDEWLVTSLIVDQGQCQGVVALELRTGKLEAFAAPAVLLATGGAGRLYQRSTASRSCTGDGMSLAYRAGLRLVDMEMVQYHPLGFRAHRAFASEATLTEGALLCDTAGQPVLPPNGPFTRDSFCRVMAETNRGQGDAGCLLLDLRPLGKDVIASHFQYLHRIARDLAGVEIDHDPLPVRPLAHRLLGGVETTLDGSTALPGLFAAGECAWLGVHGANALAGNTLITSVVFGRRAGAAAAAYAQAARPTLWPESIVKDPQACVDAIFSRQAGELTVARISHELAALMDEHVGLVRDGGGLAAAAERLTALKERYARVGLRHHGKIYNAELVAFFELASLLDVAEAVIMAAQARKESRGVHQRSDFPLPNDKEWRQHTLVSHGVNGPIVETRPVNSHLSP